MLLNFVNLGFLIYEMGLQGLLQRATMRIKNVQHERHSNLLGHTRLTVRPKPTGMLLVSRGGRRGSNGR